MNKIYNVSCVENIKKKNVYWMLRNLLIIYNNVKFKKIDKKYWIDQLEL